MRVYKHFGVFVAFSTSDRLLYILVWAVLGHTLVMNLEVTGEVGVGPTKAGSPL
jgi:hypothetical protein